MKRANRWLATGLVAAVFLSGWAGCKKKEKTSSKTAKESRAARQGTESRPGARPARGAATAPRGAAGAASKPAPLPALGSTQGGLVKVALGVRLGQVRKSVFWPLIVGLPQVKEAMADKDYKKFISTCKINPLTDLDELVVVLAGNFINAPGKPKVGLVASGNFDEASAVSCIKTLLQQDKKNKNFKDVTVGGKKGFSFTDDEGTSVFVFPLGKGKVALADVALKDKLSAGPCASSPRLQAVKKAIPAGASVWAVFGEIPMKPGSLKGPLAVLRKVKAINGGYFYIAGVGAPYVLHVALDVGTGEAAQAILQTMNMLKPMVQMMSAQKPELAKAAKVIDTLKTKVEGGTVYLSLPLPGDVVSGFKALAGQKGS